MLSAVGIRAITPCCCFPLSCTPWCLLALTGVFSGLSDRHNEAYTWTNPTCCVHNVIIGKLWIEQYGTMEILNHRYHTLRGGPHTPLSWSAGCDLRTRFHSALLPAPRCPPSVSRQGALGSCWWELVLVSVRHHSRSVLKIFFLITS